MLIKMLQYRCNLGTALQMYHMEMYHMECIIWKFTVSCVKGIQWTFSVSKNLLYTFIIYCYYFLNNFPFSLEKNFNFQKSCKDTIKSFHMRKWYMTMIHLSNQEIFIDRNDVFLNDHLSKPSVLQDSALSELRCFLLCHPQTIFAPVSLSPDPLLLTRNASLSAFGQKPYLLKQLDGRILASVLHLIGHTVPHLEQGAQWTSAEGTDEWNSRKWANSSRHHTCKIPMKSIKTVHLQGDHGDIQANFGDGWPGFKSQLYHIPPVWPRASYLLFLCRL